MTRHLPEKERRGQILAAARRCFIAHGFHPTRMDDIAKEAQLSKGGVYFHFRSKQEVFESLVEEEYAASMGFLQQVVEDEHPIQDKLVRLGQHYLSYFDASPDAPRFFVVMGEMALRDEKVAARLLEMQVAYIDMVASLLDQGVQAGWLKPVDTRATAAVLKAVLDGVEGLNALGYPMSTGAYLEAGMKLVLEGLTTKP